MKKFLIVMLAVFALVSCGDKKTSTENSEEISATQQETLQPDPYSVKTTEKVTQEKSETTTIKTQKTTNTTTETITEISETETTALTEIISETTETETIAEIIPEETQADPLGAGEFSYDEDGAVQFEESPDTENEQLMISAGQALFESACQTQWKFTVGCPYEVDTGYVARNDYGWVFYKIIDENINSFADIENDYYKVFSNRYPSEDLNTLYFERNGNVYAMNGSREMNPYYSMSRITGIESRTDDEIFFTVENFYEGNDQNPDEAYSETDTFSIVLEGDKTKAGKFRMPY